MSEQDKKILIEVVMSLIGLITVILYAYPELPEMIYYHIRLWIAHRDNVNYDRLVFMRDNRDILYSDDMKES